MPRKRHTVQVREYKEDGSFTVLKTIQCVLKAEAIGNFNPVFATFQKEDHLVKSDEGDLSDPFRRDKSYLKSLYIVLKKHAETKNPQSAKASTACDHSQAL